MRAFTTAEQALSHTTAESCWVIVDNGVYDVTSFLGDHPGGRKVLLRSAGKDASKQFHSFHGPNVLRDHAAKFLIGYIGTVPSPKKSESIIPYFDPSFASDSPSPYYNASHFAFRAAVRAFVEEKIMPFCDEWDSKKLIPRELFTETAKAGILAGCIGTPWPSQYAGSFIAGGIKPDEFDEFHELILFDEISRCGSGGVVWGLLEGLHIGLPPVTKFGSQALKDKVAGPCLRGEKIICLCITEPYAGSDVAGLKTTAVLSGDGSHFIVNGEKKWITNGVTADFFTVAVRTGVEGSRGISMLLIERSMPGITARQMDCQGVWPSGTAYITFEDVRVPVSNLIGEENKGFTYIMSNFNHERWGFVIQATRFSRVCYEDAFRYAHKRKTFGKRLIDHDVIRNKLAHMIRKIESTQAWLEQVTYQFKTLSDDNKYTLLGGPVALMKAQSTLTFEFCAREAAQIFGGLAYTRGGQGGRVERLYREVRAYAIPGGSEEILLDFGIRQAVKSSKAYL